MGLESASFLNGLVTTNPVSGDGVAQGDDHFRLLKAVLKASFPNITAARYLEQARADAADSATPALWAAATNYVNLLGTTTITGFDSGVSGQWKLVRFDGARQLTHHATTLDLPNSANITTVAGDHALVLNRGITSNIIVAYYRATGKALVETDQFPSSPAQGDIVYRNASSWVRLAAGTSGHVLRTQGAAANPIWAAETAIPVADQAGMEAASSTSTFVTPGRQHFHPGHPKAGGNFDGTGTPAFRSGDYGMGAVTDNGTGYMGKHNYRSEKCSDRLLCGKNNKLNGV